MGLDDPGYIVLDFGQCPSDQQFDLVADGIMVVARFCFLVGRCTEYDGGDRNNEGEDPFHVRSGFQEELQNDSHPCYKVTIRRWESTPEGMPVPCRNETDGLVETDRLGRVQVNSHGSVS